jgi:Holliday junction resolvase RusA-like endonuclease
MRYRCFLKPTGKARKRLRAANPGDQGYDPKKDKEVEDGVAIQDKKLKY